MRVAVCLLALAAIVNAHFQGFNVESNLLNGQPINIRNAKGPGQDGQYALGGSCGSGATGGTSTFGSNGVTAINAGTTITVTANYGTGKNGDHAASNNLISARWLCNAAGPSETDMNTASLLPGAPQVPAAQGSTTTGYPMTVTIPTNALGDCTLSVVDQRNWGTCYDFKVAAAPPSTASAIQGGANGGSSSSSSGGGGGTAAAVIIVLILVGVAGFLAAAYVGAGPLAGSSIHHKLRSCGSNGAVASRAPSSSSPYANQPSSYASSGPSTYRQAPSPQASRNAPAAPAPRQAPPSYAAPSVNRQPQAPAPKSTGSWNQPQAPAPRTAQPGSWNRV